MFTPSGAEPQWPRVRDSYTQRAVVVLEPCDQTTDQRFAVMTDTPPDGPETPEAPEASAVAVRRCRHGFLMHPRKDAYVGRSLALYGEYSEGEVALFRRFVRPGAVVLEAGANIGALTVPLARMAGEGGQVVALEPQRSLFNILCGNLALNGLMNVTPIRAAAGAEAGQTPMPVLDYDLAANYGGVASGENAQSLPTEPVRQVAIDEMALPRLDLLKADVEGAEAEVLQGARDTINRLRPVLFVENDRREKSAALVSLLGDLGYRAWWHFSFLFNSDNFNGNTNNVFGAIRSINLLCIPAEKSPAVKGLREVAGPDDWWQDD